MIWADYLIVGAIMLFPLAEATERWFGPDEGWFIKNNRTRNLLGLTLTGLLLAGLYFQDMPDSENDSAQVLTQIITAFTRVF